MIVHRKKTAPPQGMHNYIWEYEKGKWRYVIGNDKITYKEMLKDGYITKEYLQSFDKSKSSKFRI